MEVGQHLSATSCGPCCLPPIAQSCWGTAGCSTVQAWLLSSHFPTVRGPQQAEHLHSPSVFLSPVMLGELVASGAVSCVSLASKQQQELLRAVTGWVGRLCASMLDPATAEVFVLESLGPGMWDLPSVPHGIGIPRSGASIW